MKTISILIALTVVLAGCTKLDETRQAEKEIQKMNEHISELTRQNTALQQSLLSQTEKIQEMEARLTAIESKQPEALFAEEQLRNSGDNIISEPDTIVAHGNDSEIEVDGLTISSSNSGYMISDREENIVGGDLKIVSEKGTLLTEGAVVEKRGDQVVVEADSLHFTPQKENQ